MHDVHMPKVGTSGAEAEIVSVKVAVGDRVEVGQELFEADSDKATFAIEADVAGKIAEILVVEDTEYPTGSVLCRIEPDG
jgi:2-oxoisovalerate dehydrogenase E2 component (dihydrolipoyl transacylase)